MCALAAGTSAAIAAGGSGPLLYASCTLGGVGFAFGNGGGNILVMGGVTPARRGLALAVKQMGSPLSIISASLLVPPLASAFSWRVIGWIGLMLGAGVAAL